MRAREIELLLPEVLRRTAVPGSPMAALVAVMEEQHRPSEDVLGAIADIFDPLTTPDRFVPMLAEWVDLVRLDETSAGHLERDRLRLLVSLTAQVGRTRGTEAGLVQLLHLATGVNGLRLEATGPFACRLVVPAGDAAQAELIRALTEQEKPAHLVVEVVVEAPPPGGS